MRYSQCGLFLTDFFYFVAYKLFALSLFIYEKQQFHFYGLPADIYVGLPSFVQITQQHLPAGGFRFRFSFSFSFSFIF